MAEMKACGCGHEHHAHNHNEQCDHVHHDHEHKEGCGCGHAHRGHEHTEGCGCGRKHHEHEHAPGCGCGAMEVPASLDGFSPEEQRFLTILAQYMYLPVTRFLLRNSAEEELIAIALAPVVIDDLADTMDTVKQNGQILSSLEARGLISLDYDLPLDGYDYQGYRDSELYRYFERTVEESCGQPGFLFDTAELETGSMALTEAGMALFQGLNAQ